MDHDTPDLYTQPFRGSNHAPLDPDTEADIVVIGAGPAGLAVAACLMQRGHSPLVFDRAQEVASSWRRHYERLHLHTAKTHSALPGMAFPEDAPRYVPRQGVVDYLTAYARHHRIEPELGVNVEAIEPRQEPGAPWQVRLSDGRHYAANHVVVATGANRVPQVPRLPGEDVFQGRVLHSRSYRNAAPFAGQRVLVVGMGNTGAEIALDLVEHGVRAALSVRSPVNIVRREVLGRPTQLSSILLSKLPHALGDALATLFRDLTVGDLRRHGLPTARVSPQRQLREEGKTPVIDVGTVKRIQTGDILVYPGIQSLTSGGVRFTDGTEHPFDAVLLATGYQPALQALFPYTPLPLDERGIPPGVSGEGALQGVYFVGFDVRQPGGLLRTIAQQAERVAERISARQGQEHGGVHGA
ncbi:MAG: NAD(P)/FAD-dependent oxidoreductase [Hydrogenophaga sp.]|jgi:NAD(P)H-nitrite reductase large subunit|uniref:flavin-containing monooxygenase n=1 Tax=Hydrogenophaga sp. TaxID=1904254 RepID=UPI001DF97829|nr:NAD(P)/FAD-dependent oxidoreductase [Hydrogenophaga sp.]MBW0168841.1 NAD(P)/FAD-dependent oxidoreductase [Hydrogenophaga sp.]MBW0183389.1 NAD(P)/FAD-dependent oxidoreductase [Hydrogenophaga sp.]